MTRRVWSFHGGVHPPENKIQSTSRPIKQTPLPRQLILSLQQHLGQAAKPVVHVGDQVLKGQLIARAAGYISVPLHAPTSGLISAIEPHPVAHPSGLAERCIVIVPDGEDKWIDKLCHPEYSQLERTELLKIISNAGISGMGGAGFPTAVKLNPSQEITIDTLIINAAECEPYITADDMLLRERAEEVLKGVRIITHILQTKACLIGIEDNKPEAISALREAITQLELGDLIRLVVVPTKYPSGGEKQLIQLLTGFEVPSGAIPAELGIVCQNVGTAVAIYRAVELGEPLISRITTLTGNAIPEPINLEVLIGTPIQELLEQSQVDKERLHRLVLGGPMMGFTLNDSNTAIVKTSNCVLAATEEELPAPPPEQPCIRCGMCAEACPATLLPQQLYWFSKAKEFDKALSHNLLDCIECGACSYVCPSNIPLVQYYRFAKGEIRAEELEHTKSEHSRQRFEARKTRLEQQAAEKAEKRRARAAQAAAKKTDADTGSTADGKAAVIQAALQRTQAKKAQQETPVPEQDSTADHSTPEGGEA